MSRGGWISILSLVVALAAGTVVVWVAIPTMHPACSTASDRSSKTETIAMVLCAFSAFAAGLSARGMLVPVLGQEPPSWLQAGSSNLVPAGMIVIFLLSAMQALPTSTQLIPTSRRSWAGSAISCEICRHGSGACSPTRSKRTCPTGSKTSAARPGRSR